MADNNNEIKLDSPLVVHKKDDASYSENAESGMSITHMEEESSDVPTLERHRFRKQKKNHNGVWVLIALIAIAVAVVCGLFYSGKLSFKEDEPSTKLERTYVTKAENKFEGIITVKGTYIFFEGTEVDGIKGLEREIKYLDAGTKFTIQDESADSNFLNLDVLSILSQYNIDYDITYVVSSGLESKYETTTSTTAKTTSAKSTEAPKTTENVSQ